MLFTCLSPAIQMTEDVHTGGKSEGGLYHCWALHQVQFHNNLPVDMKLQALIVLQIKLSNIKSTINQSIDTLKIQVFWNMML
jgi:hypothetical protein